MEIMNDILRIVQDRGRNTKKTHLMYKANLSHKQMKSYLDELFKNGLIEGDLSSENYSVRITKKGMNFLVKYIQMREFEKTFGL